MIVWRSGLQLAEPGLIIVSMRNPGVLLTSSVLRIGRRSISSAQVICANAVWAVEMVVVPGGQMGGGTGLIRHPQLFKGLYMGPNLIGISTMVYIADLQRARREGFGNDVQAYRDDMADRHIAAFYGGVTSILSLFTLTPGGGGPRASPISTTPPLSLEATGASLAQLGKSGGPASSSKRRSRPRRKCKPGYRWNGTRCVRKD